MAKLLESDRAIQLLAKKLRIEQKAYDELPEFWSDYAERIVDYLESVLRRSKAVPPKLRPRK